MKLLFIYWIILCHCVCVMTTKLNEYVGHYELSRVDVSPLNMEFIMNKPVHSVPQPEDTIRIHLRCFKQEFDFIATRTSPGNKVPFYEKTGDCDTCLHAFGFISRGAFVGVIKSDDTTFYIEPATYYFDNISEDTNVVIYRDVDLIYPAIDESDGAPSILAHTNSTHEQQNSPKSNLNLAEVGCELEIVADYNLYKNFQGNVEDTTAFLYLHAKFADEVFRRTRFRDKKVRIVVKHTEVYTNDQNGTYPFRRYTQDFKDYLLMYTYRVQRFCLSLVICDKTFTDDAIGVTYKADTNPVIVGGICQLPVRDQGRDFSFNVGAITLRNNAGQRLNLGITLRSFLHELGHSFGSSHDDLKNLRCSPGGSLGYYIMHSRAQTQNKPLVSTFSPCSLDQISNLMAARSCLQPINAVCGNAIREGNEECDCGDASHCNEIDKCCTPKGGIGSDTGCTFRRSSGYLCSSKENSCCTDDCHIVSADKKTECLIDRDECLVSFCDGGSQQCPTPQKLADGSSCMGTSKTCQKGSCSSTICRDNGYKDCTCKEKEFACYVCCQNEAGLCRPASYYNLNPIHGRAYLLFYGTSCHGENRQCSVDGECITVNDEEKESTRSPWRLLYILLAIGSFIVVAAVAALLICYKRRRNILPTTTREPELYAISRSYRHPGQIGGLSVRPVTTPTIDVPITTRY